jgi:hypothetical protein
VPDLIEKWETLPTAEYLESRFGKQYPDPSEFNAWRTAETEGFLKSALFAIENYFVTETKAGELVPLELRVGQCLLHVCIESQLKLGLRQQIVEIKPRQVGWTTYGLARGFWRACHPNMRVSIFVLEEKVADELSKKLATFYNNLPTHLRPMKRIDNLKFVTLDQPNAAERTTNPGLNSSIFIGVPSPQRGRTPHLVVASEYAFWSSDMQMDFQTGLVAAMPLGPEACIIIDTTPNGHDESYEPLVMEALENNPKWVKSWSRKGIPTKEDVLFGKLGQPDHPERGYVPVFQPFFWHEEYTTKDESPLGELPRLTVSQKKEIEGNIGKLSKYGNDEEKELRDKYGVSIYRLWWRRRKIDSYKSLADERLRLLAFRQEYAADWSSCFVDYDLSPFDPLALDYLARNVKTPAARGILRDTGLRIEVDVTWNSEHEDVRIYAPPSGTDNYVMGVDTQIAYDSDEADSTVAMVMRVRDWKVVAVYQAKAPQYRIREQIRLLYKWYNNAYTAIETEGIGYGLVRELYDLGVTNQYYWKRLDNDMPKETTYLGWETNYKTRAGLEQGIIEALAHRTPDGKPDPLVIIPDHETVRELQTVKRDSSGNIKASSRAHDDHFMALGICLRIMADSSFPYRSGNRKNEVRMEMNALIRELAPNLGPSRRNNPSLDDL